MSRHGWTLLLGFCSTVLSLPTASVRADVKLPAIFSEHMVLQADVAAPIWGWAEPGEKVVITIGSHAVETTANAEGRWSASLPKLSAGGPQTLTVTGRNTLTVGDVLVGEVWLGSGQSNMAMTVNRARDFEQEQAAATFPQIRMFTVSSGASNSAQADCRGTWEVCSPETVARFSATAYFFGRELHRTLNVPVGLINSSVGGTPIESWISPEAQRASPELQQFFAARQAEEAKFDVVAAKAKYERDFEKWQAAVKKAKADGQAAPRKPRDPIALRQVKGNVGGLFNGKIAPLIPYAIRGALWYQGEANTVPDKAGYYEDQLKLLVTDWRTRWGTEFPFAWVQLPNFAGNGRDWPTVREAMANATTLPETGMAITIDIGETNDIHPKNKQEVGRRLALWTLGTVYGRPGPVSGPILTSHERRGREFVLTFQHTDQGLRLNVQGPSGIEVAGPDGAWKPAVVVIEQDQVIVASPDVAEPVAVRYAWSNDPQATLFNGAGLPAAPFRVEAKPR